MARVRDSFTFRRPPTRRPRCVLAPPVPASLPPLYREMYELVDQPLEFWPPGVRDAVMTAAAEARFSTAPPSAPTPSASTP